MREKLATVPRKPGIYIFRDGAGKVLYVGKAKVLKNRLRSYFQSTGLDERKAAMVRSAADFEFTITGNELEALILEANLIKQYKPRYNILLRDDKSYPYLKLTVDEKWPRLEVVRRIKKDGARYFGPYVPAGAMWETLSFIRRQYRIPNCRHSLEQRMRPCIQFQIGKCLAPCSGEVDHDAYLKMIREVELLLEGKNRNLIGRLEETMLQLSDEMKYEEAAAIRDRIRAIESVSEAQKVVSPELGDADVIGLFRQDDAALFKLFFIRNGIMIGARDFEFRHTAGETVGYLFRNLIEQFYAGELLPPEQLFCSGMPEDRQVLAAWLAEKRGGKVAITVPVRGIKRQLVAMAEENCRELLLTRIPSINPALLPELAALLQRQTPPESIGAFDISNISGTSAVGAFVWWRGGVFDKTRYRHISMEAVQGPDDYAMMREMIRRTVVSLREAARKAGRREEGYLPDLVIIDGGREHLKAAAGVFQEQFGAPEEGGTEGMAQAMPQLVGLAKDPDRVYLQNRSLPVPIGDGRPAALLLRQIRDEVHRFGLRYHRKLRGKKMFESRLESIYGLGRRRRFALLEHFGSLEAIRKAPVEDIAGIKGFTRKLAEDVLKALA